MLNRPSHPLEVLDTVGAGDSFTAAMLASLRTRGVGSPTALTELADAAVAQALDDAILASARTCERAGADPPAAPEIRRRTRSSAGRS